MAGAIGSWLASATKPGQEADRTNAAQEAVELYRHLVDRYGNHYQQQLAMSLNNLASFLSDQDFADKALIAAEESATIYERLPRGEKDDSTTVVLLGTRSVCLLDVSRFQEAANVSKTAIAMARNLPQSDGERRVSDLALCLYVRGICLAQRGDATKANGSLEEALQLMESRSARDALCTERYLPKIKAALERLRDAHA